VHLSHRLGPGRALGRGRCGTRFSDGAAGLCQGPAGGLSATARHSPVICR